jgi:hypothetical protein
MKLGLQEKSLEKDLLHFKYEENSFLPKSNLAK